MPEPSVTSDVKVLDQNYQPLAKGTLGWGLNPNDNTAMGVLTLVGLGIVADGLELTGAGHFFTEQQGDVMVMGTNVLLTGQAGDITLYLMFTSWGDSPDLLGYFYAGEQEPGVRPYIITT